MNFSKSLITWISYCKIITWKRLIVFSMCVEIDMWWKLYGKKGFFITCTHYDATNIFGKIIFPFKRLPGDEKIDCFIIDHKDKGVGDSCKSCRVPEKNAFACLKLLWDEKLKSFRGLKKLEIQALPTLVLLEPKITSPVCHLSVQPGRLVYI